MRDLWESGRQIQETHKKAQQETLDFYASELVGDGIMKLTIKFSHNWNGKVFCNLFTTIRKSSQSKFLYYDQSIGQKFDVSLNDRVIGQAVLKSVKGMRFHEIDPIVTYLDTGMDSQEKVNELFKRFGIDGDTMVLVLLFESVK